MVDDNIILTGFMGTGKTTVGRLLAERLGREFVDTDDLIVARAGRPIADIFNDDGETRFREWEAQVAGELAGRRGLVIATGGRLMLDPDNAAALGATGPVLCLTADPADILARVAAEDGQRPLLAGDDPETRVRALLRRRAAAYGRFRAVETGGLAAEDVAATIATLLAGGPRETLPVRHPTGSYDVIVGEDLLSQVVGLAGISGPAAIITDSHVGPRHAATLQKPSFSEQPGFLPPILTMPAGETHKTLDTVRELYDGLLAAGLGRDATIIALGGGVVGDVAGFVAATYLRGVDFVLCPTTLLAMVDSSIGGKTGVDMPQGKNLIGAFKQPRLVLADVLTLATLPADEFTAGLAEVAKHGLIADPILWQRLMMEEWHFDPRQLATDRLLRADLQSLIVRAIRVKRDVVEEDPYEAGRRALLNLGHTFGHAIEQVSGYAVRHGEAVAMGLAAAAHLSAALGECAPSLPRLVEMVLTRLGLPIHIPPALDPAALYAAMGSDKKKKAGQLRFVLIRDVGDVFLRDGVPAAAVLAALEAVRMTTDH
ncbi:Shikimate kinase/3-dehydroquinate synthase [Candidatus Promineifilum breve]|uniref:Multifunctional fusion protein n=1 Tax=Candidatus Promineifilum breve TaxID=1806508 RepID=A0A160T448_9CHLR|nr:3-dehydroquinate synthase [Candidatus Promineifilum breve]CUS03828.2 Shikimate kinase/3-dehydroquinate synthase [Candidatus Promineifilum breve]